MHALSGRDCTNKKGEHPFPDIRLFAITTTVIGLCQCLLGEAASAKALLELVDTTAGVDDFLRAGVERVAS